VSVTLIGWVDGVELSAPTGSANGAAAMPKISNTNKILRTVSLLVLRARSETSSNPVGADVWLEPWRVNEDTQ